MIPTMDKVALEAAGSLTLNTGFSVGWAPGTATYLTGKGVEGWTGSSPIRRNKAPLMGAHGTHAERGFKDERLITVTGHHVAADRAAAGLFADDLAAFLGDGEWGVFRINDASLGPRWAEVYLAAGGVDVTWTGGVDVSFQIFMVAPDPRKYGTAETSAPAGVPVPGNGLVFPLFSRPLASTTTSRTNYATNPRAVGTSTGFAAYLSGTGETGALTFLSGQADGPAGGPSSYARWTVTAAKTGGSSGWAGYGSTYRAPKTGTTGQTETVSVWVRYTGAGTLNMILRAYCYAADGTSAGFQDSAAVTLTSGAWTRLTSTVTATKDYASVGWWGMNTASYIAPAGSTLDATGLLAGATGTYFDGSTPAAGDGEGKEWTYAWTGTTDSSSSAETELTYTGADGVLDIGSGGYLGRASATNTGTADTGVRFTIWGDHVPGFTIIDLATGRRLVYTETLTAGQTLVLDSDDGSVTLDGYAPRDSKLTVSDWTRLGRGETGTWQFESPGSIGAQFTVEVTPAWW